MLLTSLISPAGPKTKNGKAGRVEEAMPFSWSNRTQKLAWGSMSSHSDWRTVSSRFRTNR